MDADTIRRQLNEVQAELQRVDATRKVLVDLVNGYQGWLELNASGESVQPRLNLPEVSKPKRSNVTVGTISVRGAILKVMQDAHGETLHSDEIWRRAERLGARTNSPHPKDVVDLNLFGLRKTFPIEKVAARQYRWKNGVVAEVN